MLVDVRRFASGYRLAHHPWKVYGGIPAPGRIARAWLCPWRGVPSRQLKKNISAPVLGLPSLWPVFDLPLLFGVLGGVAVQRGHEFHGSGIGGDLLALFCFGGIEERGGMCGGVDLLQGA